MIIRMIKAELKYCYYELASVGKANTIFMVLFVVLYTYCSLESKFRAQYTSAECYIIIQIVSLYVLLRMVMTGLSLPNNVYESEVMRERYLKNNGLTEFALTNQYLVRICIKTIFACTVNILTMFMIMSALNLVADVKNLFLLAMLIYLGTFFMMALGIGINLLMVSD